MKKIFYTTVCIFLFTCYFITSVQAQGFQWAKSIGAPGMNSVGLSITTDASGNVYTTGQFSGTVDFDPGPGTFNLTSAGGLDVFISKLDASSNFIWAKRMGGTGTDVGNSIATDSSRNVYITGKFQGTADFDPGVGVFNLTSTGGNDVFIAKLDASGNFVWATKNNTADPSNDYGNSITTDASGNAYTTGYSMFSNYITKLDTAGNFVWTRNIDGLGKSYIAKDDFGNVYTTGTFSGTRDFDPGVGTFTLSASWSSDIYISKLDTAGNFKWAKALDQTYVNSIKTDVSGNVYTTGQFNGTADFDPGVGVFNLTSVGSYDVFISKLDSSGNFVWAKSMGGAGPDQPSSITTDASGNVYTTGYFQFTADFDPGAGTFYLYSAELNDIFISKLNSSGNFVWAKAIVGTGSERCFSMATDTSDNVYITGFWSAPDTADFDPGAGVYNLTAVGTNDIFIAKYCPCNVSTFSTTPTSCNGGSNGTATAIMNEGTPPFIFLWSNGQTTSTATGLSAGTYTLSTTEALGCSTSETVSITQPSALSTSFTNTDVSCNGRSDGTATAISSGGIAPYSYLWSNSQTSQTATGLYATSYSVITTDANSCTASSSTTINQPSMLACDSGVDQTICNGTNASLGVTPNGGTYPYNYSWSPSAGLNFSNISDPTASPTITTTYTITVTDNNGCTAMDSVQIIINPLSANPTGVLASANTICIGATTTLTVTGGSLGTGAGWHWYSSSCGASSEGTGSSISVSPTTNQIYYVRAEGTCNTTSCASVTVTVSNPILTISNTDVSCNGGSDGSATAIPSGGIAPYSYSWSNSQTSQTATGLSAITYSVITTDASGCTYTTTVGVSQPTVLTATVSAVVNASCYNSEGSMDVTANGGTIPYSYFWSNNSTTQNISGLSFGNYSVTVTDSNNCTTNTNAVINNSVPSAALPICAVTVDSLSQYNVIVWDKTSYPIADTFFVYRDTANNGYGLIGKVPHDSLSQFIDTSRTKYAANGDPNATTWKYKIAVKDTCGNISAMSPYHKTLFIQNNNGNFSWNDYIIEGQPVPVTALQNYLFQRDNFSNGNWVTIQTLSASSLSFTDGAYSTYQNTATWRVRTVWSISCVPTIINPKNPSINATNINTSHSNNMRNSITCTATITGSTTICAGQNTTLTASGGVFYSWSNGYTTTSIIVSPTATTTYSVTATTGTCVATASVTVTVNPMPTASINGNTTICSGDAATLTATGGGTYSWSNGATSAVIYPSAAGTYSVIASVGFCSDTASATVTLFPLLSLSATATNATAPTCCDGSATVSVSGGTPGYTYIWSPVGCITTTCSGLCSGNYTVTVMDANGCYQTATVTVSCPTAIDENNSEVDFSIFPNPTNGLFQIQVGNWQSAVSKEYKIEVYNVYGEKIYSTHVSTPLNMTNQKIEIDLSTQPQGIYFLQLKTSDGTTARKVVISR